MRIGFIKNLNLIIMKRNLYFTLLLLIMFFFTACNDDLSEEVKVNKEKYSIQIPEWAKEQITDEEMKILDKLNKEYKLTFFKVTDEDKSEYIQIKDIDRLTRSVDDQESAKEIATILQYPRLKLMGEGSQSKLGRVSVVVHEKRGASSITKVTAYWGYSYVPGKITSINSFDVDHTVTGLGFQTYFVSQGSTYQISSNGREIEYIVAGAVRYRATTAGELGVEVTVTEFSMHGKVAPKVY